MSGTGHGTKRNPNAGEVWMADFPFEENNGRSKVRPVIIVDKIDDEDIEILELDEGEYYLSTKVTTHEVRDNDEFDTVIVKWREANLKNESIARVSKTIILSRDKLLRFKGVSDSEDFESILNKYIEFTSKED